MASTGRSDATAQRETAGVDQRFAEELERVTTVGETGGGGEEIEQRPHRGRDELGRAPLERFAQCDDVDPQQAPNRLGGPDRAGIVVGVLGQQDARERLGIDGLTVAQRPQQHLEAQLTNGHGEQMNRIVGPAAR